MPDKPLRNSRKRRLRMKRRGGGGGVFACGLQEKEVARKICLMNDGKIYEDVRAVEGNGPRKQITREKKTK